LLILLHQLLEKKLLPVDFSIISFHRKYVIFCLKYSLQETPIRIFFVKGFPQEIYANFLLQNYLYNYYKVYVNLDILFFEYSLLQCCYSIL